MTNVLLICLIFEIAKDKMKKQLKFKTTLLFQ